MRATSHSLLFAAAALVLAAASSVLLVGCAEQATPTTPVASPTVDAAAVNRALADVAAAREAAAAAVDAELRAVARVDPMVAGLRSPSTVDATLEDVPAIVTLVAEGDPAGSAAHLDALDTAIVDARAAIDDVAGQLDADSWQASFLDAQRAVLAALAEWSAASRVVDTVVADHWTLWSDTVASAAVLDEDRWRYRSTEEAAGTWEIAISDRIGPLAQATAALAPAVAARDEAAVAVAAADDHAAEVFAARPEEP